jgi:hypothetical protein
MTYLETSQHLIFFKNSNTEIKELEISIPNRKYVTEKREINAPEVEEAVSFPTCRLGCG